MAKKTKMMALLRRCREMVDGEIALLEGWRRAGGITSARKADCRRSIEHIAVGASSASSIVDNVLTQAGALAEDDITNEPSDGAVAAVENLEQNLENRESWDGPDLEQLFWESALSQSEDNAAHAADAAAGILSHATS